MLSQIRKVTDPRYFQIAFLSSFFLFGIHFLGWPYTPWRTFFITATCVATQYIAIKYYNLSTKSLLSAIVSVLGLLIILRANSLYTFMLAAFLTIASKFLIRYKEKHIFNPVNFGIISTILLTDDAWISPGQWGNSSLFFLILGVFSFLVLVKVKQLSSGLTFLGVLFLCEFMYIIVYQGWPLDHLLHKFTSGSLLLFSFFMITDPRTTPGHQGTRVIWSSAIAVTAFYFMEWHYIHAAPFWVLFFASPLTPFLDHISKAQTFHWKNISSKIVQPS